MKKISILPILLSLAYGLAAQPMTEPEIDALVQRSLVSFHVPGIAVAIIKDGKPVLMKGYGVRSLDSRIPMNENTLFGIASNSKAFTAAALGILKEEGKLKWDDRVIDYIPEFRLYDPYVTHDFRIRDLLCHRSGMGLGAGDLMIWPDGTDFTRQDVIHNLRFLKQVSPFRTKYDYDNLLYIVAGEIIAKVSGQSWEDFIETRIFAPLGMTQSKSSFNRLAPGANIIDAHAEIEGTVRVIARTSNDLMNAAGGIYSSVSEMAKWATYLLESPNSLKIPIQELWSPQTIIPVNNPGPYNTHFAAYGLGFRLADEKGFKVISHTGGLAGIVTQMTLIPELNLAIIVFTNQQVGAAFSAITNQIKDGYFGLQGIDWVARYSAAMEGSRGNAQKILNEVFSQLDQNAPDETHKKGKEIIGSYTDPWFGQVKLREEDGRIFFRSIRSPGLTGELFWYKGNTWVVKWTDRSMDADAFILFETDYNGLPAGFSMKAISPLTDFSFDFHDLKFKRE